MTNAGKPQAKIADLWHINDQDKFVLLFRGQPLIEQGVIYRGASERGAVFDFYWRTHAEIIGGGATTETAARLMVDAQGKAQSYEIFSDRQAVRRIEFEPDQALVTLSDNSLVTIPLEAAPDFVFQNNIVLQFALVLSLQPSDAEERRLRFFSPNSLKMHAVGVKYSGGVWETSLGMNLRLEGSLLQEVKFTTDEKDVSGAKRDFQLPDKELTEFRRAPAIVYHPPTDIGIRVTPAAIEAGDITLQGAYSVPADAEGPRPAFLFLQGSGAIDKHGMAPGIDVGSHSICDALTAKGLVGLRIDVRGTGETAFGDTTRSPFQSRVGDAETALRWLVRQENVAADHVFLIGHSLGALAILELLNRVIDIPVKGIVLLAPPGRSLGSILIEQALREARRLQLDDEAIAQRRQALAEWLCRVRSERNSEKTAPMVPGSFLTLAQADVIRLLPRRLLNTYRGSILICQGSKDIQVSLQKDALALVKAAEQYQLDVELRVYPNLNHLFKYEPGVPTPASYFEPRPVDARFLESLASWLTQKSPGWNLQAN